MVVSRRKFISRTGILAAGTCLVPSVSFDSCRPSRKSGQVRMGYIGTEENFRYYKAVFRKLKNAGVELTSFNEAVKGDFHALFLDTHPPGKSSRIILLLEQYKDILTPYPLAGSLDEYGKIQEFLVASNRIIGMLNPLYFYPSLKTLKGWLGENQPDISMIRVGSHPDQLAEGFSVLGEAGAVQPLQRMISHVTDKFPVSLLVEGTKEDPRRHWIFDYGSFQAIIHADPGQTGWIMEVEGPHLKILADHTGLLTLNDDVKPRLFPAADVWEGALLRNIQDFIHAVRSRNEPVVGSLDGLSAIILNEATRKSMPNGIRINL